MFYKMKTTIFLGTTDPKETHKMIDIADALEKFYRKKGYVCSRTTTSVSVIIDIYQYDTFSESLRETN